MTTANEHPLGPRASREFGKAVLKAAGTAPDHVLAGSIKVEIVHSEDAMASVRWECYAHVPVETIKRILREVQEPAHGDGRTA